MTDFKALVGIIIGIAIGIAVRGFFDKPCPEIKSTTTKTVTTEITKTEGVPDTSIKVKSQKSKLKIKSIGKTEFKLDKDEVGVKEITIRHGGQVEQSNNDSGEVEVEFQYPETTIKQTDEVSTKTTIKDSVASVEEIEEEDKWQVAIGSLQNFENEVEVNKYFEISYQKKIWFFYLKGFAGIHNKLNDALSNLKIHTKLEINIPLN